MSLDGAKKIAHSAGATMLLCAPITTLASSQALQLPGRLAIGVVGIAGFVVLLTRTSSRPTYVVCLLIFAMMGTSLLSGRALDGRAYIQLTQLFLFGLVIASHRVVEIGPRSLAALLVVLGSVATANILLPPFQLTSAARHFPQFAGAFENPNTLGASSAGIAILIFRCSRAATTLLLRAGLYTFLAVFIAFIVVSGARSALLVLGVYFAVSAVLRFLPMSQIWLKMLGSAALVAMVLLVTLGFPILFGAKISFLPTEPLASRPSATEPLAWFTRSEKPSSPYGDRMRADGGFFGIKKSPDSGRAVIWASVISAAGGSPIWGHGAGSHPGHLLPPPETGKDAHNGYLQIYYQMGIVGLTIYIGLWVTTFIRAVRPEAVDAIPTIASAVTLELFEVIMIQHNFGIGITFAILMTTSSIPLKKGLRRQAPAKARNQGVPARIFS